MKILVCPDKFKGSLSAGGVADAITAGILRALPDATVTRQALADGGEGSLEVVRPLLPLPEHRLEVTGPLRRPVTARYLMGNGVAYVESAEACGLQHVPPHRRDPGFATSIGVGQMIEDAIARGAEKINLFLGGSATNDAGVGMAAALGWQFFSDRGNDFVPSGNSLAYVLGVSNEEVSRATKRARITAICDVRNPLLGPEGATLTYARQKGAGKADLATLESHMTHLATSSSLWEEVAAAPYAGAAGGLGFGAKVFLGADLVSGIDWLMEAVDLRGQVAAADLVITGEGKIDGQTLRGKVVSGVGRLGLETGTPVWAVTGVDALSAGDSIPGVRKILSLTGAGGVSAERGVREAEGLLTELVRRALAAM